MPTLELLTCEFQKSRLQC